MITLRALFLDNPELRRNLRIELRPTRAMTAGIITALFAVIVLPSLLAGTGNSAAMSGSISTYLMVALWSQRLTLTFGGAVACWRAVRRERELNTFDFQRITRLSPLELAVGKLFGAPALAYFVTLCLVPPAVLSATTSGTFAVELLAKTYVLLFTGSVVVHAFALMISTVSDKGGAVSGVVILLLLQILPSIGWIVVMPNLTSAQGMRNASALHFYGIAIPPTILWAALELGFAAWFLLAVVRNIKIDLDATQLFTPRQGLGFAAYCNFVWIGFYPWSELSDNSSVAPLLLFGVLLFYAVGVGVLPSRELLRRGLRGGKAALSAAAMWLGPLGLLLAGALATQVVIVALAGQHPGAMPSVGPSRDWFLVLYFTAWVGRDLLFLQWMKVRPGRAPLRKAFLYLLVFYISTSILFRSSFTSVLPESAAVPAFLTPLPVLRNWVGAQWDAAFGVLVTALIMQLGAAAFFAYLYRQQVEGLASRPQPSPPSGPARLPSPAA